MIILNKLNEYILETKDILLKSPVRNYLSKDRDIPFKKVIKHNLAEIMDNFTVLSDKPFTQLKVVIMGEVKAGKSTLVNALLGKEVSEVDVLESTSSIINIFYSEKEVIEEKQDYINMGIDKEILRDINIVDTPGLKSIMKENETKSIQYIQNADIILYVFDSTHIGQEDIKEAIELISSYGKPIVGVLNKGDLIQDSYQEILEYIEEDYDLFIDKFFIISSYLEFQENIIKNTKAKKYDIISDYDDYLKENFKSLVDFLIKIKEDTEKIRLKSLESSIEALKHKEKIYHYDYKKSIDMLNQEIKNHKHLLNEKLEYIKSKMEYEINDWLNKIFFRDEIYIINKNINIACEYINDSYINELIIKEKEILDELFFNEWNDSIKEINSINGENIKEFIKDIDYKNYNIELPQIEVNEEQIDVNEMLASIGTGAILGATSGSAVAVYAATLSSAAPSVTIGAAMLSYCPPLLLAGTVSGGIGKVLYDKLKQEQINKQIIEDIESFIEDIRYDIKKLLESIYNKASKEIVRIDQAMFETDKGACIGEYELEKLQLDLKNYIEKL